jgi:hypothetical protein
VIAGLVEDELEKLLLTAGRVLTSAQVKEIFVRGALRNFARKVDTADLFDLIDEAVRADLHIIRNIRNKFAHTARFVYFDSPHVDQNCRRLSNSGDGMSNAEAFRRCALARINTIKFKAEELLHEKALKEPPEIVEGDD